MGAVLGAGSVGEWRRFLLLFEETGDSLSRGFLYLTDGGLCIVSGSVRRLEYAAGGDLSRGTVPGSQSAHPME